MPKENTAVSVVDGAAKSIDSAEPVSTGSAAGHVGGTARRSYGRALWAQLRRNERGDVPGWVLITLMTAGLVLLVWAIAGPALEQIFQQAIKSVTGIAG